LSKGIHIGYDALVTGEATGASPGSSEYRVILDRGPVTRYVDPRATAEMLKATYWGEGHTQLSIVKLIARSTLVAVAFAPEQVGFARAVTDYTAFGYIADVVVREDWRRQGVGRAMVELLVDQANVDWLLHTTDAHEFYESLGFERRSEVLMEKRKKRKS
jgi:GNAT superfamily N-acetyltransferase